MIFWGVQVVRKVKTCKGHKPHTQTAFYYGFLGIFLSGHDDSPSQALPPAFFCQGYSGEKLAGEGRIHLEEMSTSGLRFDRLHCRQKLSEPRKIIHKWVSIYRSVHLQKVSVRSLRFACIHMYYLNLLPIHKWVSI